MQDITETEIILNEVAIAALKRIIKRLRAKIEEVGDQD